MKKVRAHALYLVIHWVFEYNFIIYFFKPAHMLESKQEPVGPHLMQYE